ncbi:MAG: hypothetical protein K0S32_1100 [Bacteroidetes bacterium]|jgi:cytochrome c5|nr:hypothetical protein [Bacteroidota bacterium]
MTKQITLFAAVAVISIAACKTSSKTTASSATAEISQEQVDISKKRWSESSLEKLTQGKSIFTGQCTNCHKAYRIESFGEKKWLHEIDDMSPKAKLTAEEKQNLTYYILSYRDMKAGPTVK